MTDKDKLLGHGATLGTDLSAHAHRYVLLIPPNGGFPTLGNMFRLQDPEHKGIGNENMMGTT